MEADLANLSLEDGEEGDPVPCMGASAFEEEDHKFCLVDKALTDCVIHFPSLKRTLADLWHPLGGVTITDLGDKMYLFRFFYEVDIQRVIDGIPWSFNRHLIIFHQLGHKEDPKTILVNFSYFWIQLHNLPYGVVSERLARNLGDFIGEFVKYDAGLIAHGERRYMRFRVKIDVRLPLKRKKKLLLEEGRESHAKFQYERLSILLYLWRLRTWRGILPNSQKHWIPRSQVWLGYFT